MDKFLKRLQEIRENPTIRNKIIFTLIMLALYRLLVFIPVPFVHVDALMAKTLDASWGASGLGYFLMLLWGALDQFSLIALGLAPYINASIIMQLMWSVVPKLEELTEQGEVGQQKIAQYTRYLTVPLAFLQAIGMVFFINIFCDDRSSILPFLRFWSLHSLWQHDLSCLCGLVNWLRKRVYPMVYHSLYLHLS